MKEFFKKLGTAPFSVKLSFVFLSFVAFCVFLVEPGRVLFTLAVIYAVVKILDWFADNE